MAWRFNVEQGTENGPIGLAPLLGWYVFLFGFIDIFCKIYNSVLGLLILLFVHYVNVAAKTNPNIKDTKTLDKLSPLPPDLYTMMVVKQVAESPPWPY